MSRRSSSLFQIKASEDASSSLDDLKEKVKNHRFPFCPNHFSFCFSNKISFFPLQWDALENKSTVIVYGGGAIVAIWLSSIVIGAVNSVPLVCVHHQQNKQDHLLSILLIEIIMFFYSFQRSWSW